MVRMTPSLLTFLLGYGSFGKSFHKYFKSFQLDTERELLPFFPSFFSSPRGTASLTSKHLTTTGPHLPGVRVAVSKALLMSGFTSGPLTHPHFLLQSTLLMPAFPFMDGKIRPNSLWAQVPASPQAENWQYSI